MGVVLSLIQPPLVVIQPRELSIQPSWVPLSWKEYIREYYANIWSFSSTGADLPSYNRNHSYIRLCKADQPKSLKFSYWLGVAQVLAACIIAPFNPPVAGTLALNGINMAVQAGCEAHKNMEQWEQEQGAQRRKEEEAINGQ